MSEIQISARRLAVAALMASTLCIGNATAQVSNPAYSDYFLYGQFGEVCTMCEVTVLCTEGDEAPAETLPVGGGRQTLFHLQTRTFWSQMSTIGEWFVANFGSDGLAAKGHTRPVHVYHIENGVWSSPNVIEARLILDPPELKFGDVTINRVDRSYATEDATTGFCTRLPLWETLEAIEENAPEEDA